MILAKQQPKAVREATRFLKACIIPVGMWLLFAILTGGRTATQRMFMNTMRQSVTASVICYGLMLNMSVGMLNFSGGAMMLFAGIIGGNLAQMTGTGIPGMVVFIVAISVAVGLLTGMLYKLMRVPCIVLSIGLMLAWEAAPKLIFSDGLNLKVDMAILARNPHCFYVLGICLVLFFVLFNLTAFGHNLRAIGNNQAIANSVGLNGDKIKLLSFVFSAIFMGIASVLYMSERGEVRNIQTMGSLAIMMDGFMAMFFAKFLARYCDMSIAVAFCTFSMKMLTNGFVAMGISSTMRDVTQGFFPAGAAGDLRQFRSVGKEKSGQEICPEMLGRSGIANDEPGLCITSLEEDVQHGRIVLRRDVRHLQGPALRVEIGATQVRDFLFDRHVVVAIDVAEIFLLGRGRGVGPPVERVDRVGKHALGYD